MAIIGLQKGSGKRSKVREKSVKSRGILIWIMSGNPDVALLWRFILTCSIHRLYRLYAMYLGMILYRSSSNTMGYILKKFMKDYNQKKR